jgi:hypothetical protein
MACQLVRRLCTWEYQCGRRLSFVPNFKPLTPIGLDSRRVWPFIVADPN